MRIKLEKFFPLPYALSNYLYILKTEALVRILLLYVEMLKNQKSVAR